MTDVVIILVVGAIFIYLLVNLSWWIFSSDHEKCYNKMEQVGNAALGMCGGKMGGDKSTEYLDYDCINCPYFVRTIDGKEVWKK